MEITDRVAATSQVDLSSCDAEPIHIPGAIQPHGFLVGYAAQTGQIVYATDNLNGLIGKHPAEILGTPIDALLDSCSLPARHRAVLQALSNGKPEYLFTIKFPHSSSVFDAVAHRMADVVILEFEVTSNSTGFSAPELYRMVQSAITRLQTGQSVSEMSRICARQVRKLNGFDRVMVYRFDPEWNGQVIAEDKRDDLESFLGLNYPAADIPTQARELYQRNWLRFIADRDYVASRLLAAPGDHANVPLDMSYSVLRSVSPIHIEYLRNMGVTASMSISLLQEGKLWGLIACHHYSGPKFVPYDVRTACELLGQFMSLHLLDAEHRENQGAQVAGENALKMLLENMRRFEDVTKAMLESSPTILDLIPADGAAVIINNEIHRIGHTPAVHVILELNQWIDRNTADEVFSTDHLSGVFGTGLLSTVAAGVLSVSLAAASKHRFIWFRTEKVRTVDWAGDPAKSVTKGDGIVRLSPRGSFALWKETVRGRSHPWTETEVQTAYEFHTGVMRLLLHRTEQLAASHSELRLASEERTKMLDSERAARTEAERLSRAKDDFVATLSHELRTPLNAILGWAQILNRRSDLDEDLTEGLGAIERNARSQSQMIGDLLDISRIISGKLRLDLLETYLPSIVEAAIETVGLAAAAKEIRFEKMLDPLVGLETTGDSGRLQQVVWNLLANAVKFTPRGGKVQIVLERVQSHVELSVSDTGTGISEEVLPFVFDRFSQGDSSASRKHGGLGLGLSIVRNLVELHGGTVRASSPGIGRGSTFVVCLPVRVAQRQAADKALKPQDPLSDCERLHLSGVRVLVVDDQPDARLILRRMLEECSCKVSLAGSKTEALDRLRNESFDVIISDIGMPGGDGYELLREWRVMEAELGKAKIPAIALTAYVRSEDRRRSIMAGFQAHLDKPVESGEMLAQVASLAGRV